MKQSIKNKQAVEKASIAVSEFDMDDALIIDPKIRAEIEAKGLVCRWINGHKFKDNYGFDARRWVPYKTETGMGEAFGGKDSEGYIRRGDLILAVRTKEMNAAHKAKIDRKNKTLAAAQNKQAADELRQRMKDAGVKGVKILEGYEANGEDE